MKKAARARSPGAKHLDGFALASRRVEDLRRRAGAVRTRLGRAPRMALMAFGDELGRALHVARKLKAAVAADVDAKPLILPPRASTTEALRAMARLADDPRVDGIFLQFPFPAGVDGDALSAALPVTKDIDVMSAVLTAQYLTDESALPPVTVSAALELVDAYDVRINGRQGVVVADDSAFARMFRLAFARRGAATMRIVSPDSPDLTDRVKRADLVIVAAGRPGIVRSEELTKGTVAIDVGYFNPGGHGDIETAGGTRQLDAIAPVPGSIGPMTVSCLIERTILFAERTSRDAASR